MSSLYVEFAKPIDDYCEANSCSFGMASKPIAGGTSRSAQKNGFQFTKSRDSLSQPLFQLCVTGSVIGTVWIESYRGDEDEPYITYTLSNVVVSSFDIGRDGSESVGLNYTTMKAAYAGR